MSSAGDPPAEGEKAPAGGRKTASQPFRVNVRSLRATPGTRKELHVAGALSELRVRDAWVPDDKEVRFDGFIESTLGGVTVGGAVTAPYEGVCRRCLEAASGEIRAEVREICRERRRGSEEPDEDEPYPLGVDALDLQPIVHDACILELPLAPLCSESCLGLCPTCGVNRNRTECSCDAPTDARWAALAGLSEGEAPAAGDGEESQRHERQ